MAEFTVLSEEEETVEIFRKEGNEAFKAGRYEDAVEKYTGAIELCCGGGDSVLDVAALFSNRSASYLKMNMYEESLNDANSCVEAKPGWIKGHYRKVVALKELKKWKETLLACKAALKIDKNNRPILKIYKTVSKETKIVLPGGEEKKKKKKSRKKAGTPSKSSTPVLDEQSNEYLRLLNRMKRMANEDSVAGGMIEKTFIALMDPKQFQQRIYPGVSLPEDSPMPKNLKELLNNPLYQRGLVEAMPTVIAKADRIIDNVKRKGALKGDIMDKQTEGMLRPQVLMEAFAREIANIVMRTQAMVSKHFAIMEAKLASPEDERADWDMLDDSVYSTWKEGAQGFGVADNFLGDDWPGIVVEDIERLKKVPNRFQPFRAKDVFAKRMGNQTQGATEQILHCWVSPTDEKFKDLYPALSELCDSLEAIPFQMNKTCEKSMGLVDPTGDQVLVTYVPTGCSLEPRYDGQSGNVQSGVLVTATYCPVTAPDAVVDLTLPNVRKMPIDVKADRLILHRSLTTKFGIPKVESPKGVYTVTSFFRTKKQGKQQQQQQPGQ